MRQKRLLLAICTVLLILAGCGAKLSADAEAIVGSWAYIHEKDVEIAGFRKNGTAKYEGKSYRFESDGEYISLTDRKGSVQTIRYRITDDGMYLYKRTTYTYDGADAPKGLIGHWSNPNNWSFEFTEQGTFMEDGYFPGLYEADEEAGTVRLVYNDQFEDTVCYFEVDGNTLYMEYPWKVVPTTK